MHAAGLHSASVRETAMCSRQRMHRPCHDDGMIDDAGMPGAAHHLHFPQCGGNCHEFDDRLIHCPGMSKIERMEERVHGRTRWTEDTAAGWSCVIQLCMCLCMMQLLQCRALILVCLATVTLAYACAYVWTGTPTMTMS